MKKHRIPEQAKDPAKEDGAIWPNPRELSCFFHENRQIEHVHLMNVFNLADLYWRKCRASVRDIPTLPEPWRNQRHKAHEASNATKSTEQAAPQRLREEEWEKKRP